MLAMQLTDMAMTNMRATKSSKLGSGNRAQAEQCDTGICRALVAPRMDCLLTLGSAECFGDTPHQNKQTTTTKQGLNHMGQELKGQFSALELSVW